MKVLRGENIHDEILRLIPDFVNEVINDSIDATKGFAAWDLEKLNRNLEIYCLEEGSDFVTDEEAKNWDYETLESKILEEVISQYEAKISECRELGVDFNEIERVVLLKNVDNKWIDHIDAMDQLRRGISLRSYAQENPINAYKKEGMEMFDEMIYNIRHDTLRILLKIKVNVEQKQHLEKETERTQVANDMVTVGGTDVRQPITKKPEVGRNDPCPCGSGKKYKNCCGK